MLLAIFIPTLPTLPFQPHPFRTSSSFPLHLQSPYHSTQPPDVAQPLPLHETFTPLRPISFLLTPTPFSLVQPPNLTTNNAQRLPQLYSHKAWVRKHLPSYWSVWFGKAKKKDESKSENRDGNAEHDDRSMRSNQSSHREGRGDGDDHDSTYTFVRLTQLD
jgi:hypothetical protein